MTRRSEAWYTRWGRHIFGISLISAIAVGAAVGVEARPDRPIGIEAATAEGTAAYPMAHTALFVPEQPSAYLPFVVPQPRLYTPYGTPANTPKMGEPAAIEITQPVVQTCDLLSDTITRSVTVFDLAGNPVTGAYVVFTVTRSDIAEPQKVGASTDIAGQALVTVREPENFAGQPPVYQITATIATEVGNQELHFSISDFTCTSSVAG